MADQYTKVTGAAEIPKKIIVTDTLYADGMALVTYAYNWGVEGTPGDYSYYTRTLRTEFSVAKTNIVAVRNAIREDYQEFVAAWDALAAERAQVAGWIGFVILE